VTTPAVGSGGTVTATDNTSLPPTGATPVVFTLVVKVDSGVLTGTPITNTATVTPTDSNPGNNSSGPIIVTALAQLDFGDAPDGQTLSNGVVAHYGTLNANDGARHVIVGANPLHLGATVDSELDGSPSLAANTEADDDGVTISSQLLAGREATVIINSSGVGKVDAWIDFGRDGKFDPADRIATSFPVVAGDNLLSFAVPANAAPGQTYARFRLSTAGVAGPTGLANDGEVEDYTVNVASAAAVVHGVGIIPDPERPGVNMLDIEGTANADSISLTQLRSFQLLVNVTMDGKTYGPFHLSDFQWVVIHGGKGNDRINVTIARPAEVYGEDGDDTITGGGSINELYGGMGNDTLNGGKLDNLLVGGAGNDRLTGGIGRNVMIGGTGVDQVKGGSHDNLLIGNSYFFENSHAATDAVFSIWRGAGTFQQRTNALAPFLLPTGAITDDGVRDTLTGSTSASAPNWFIDEGLVADAIVNFNPKKDRKN
jgi:Ca2+-binding RTX toxin-like protein